MEMDEKWERILNVTCRKDGRQTICNTGYTFFESTDHLYRVLKP